MSNEISTQAKPAVFDLSPQTFEQALTFSQYLADSDMVPKDFKGKPGNCLVAIQWGMEIGLKPMQALQNIAVINGRPSLWGDAVIALARNSPACEYIVEEDDGHTAMCKVKRRGEAEQVRTFSMDDAKRAGLAGKTGPWTQYPKRMRQMRARAFAIRDVFPDALKGLPVAEEVMDTPPVRDMGAANVAPPAAGQDLIGAARAAADKGRDEFGRYWKSLTQPERGLLRDEVGDLKRRTEAADRARTVETVPAAPAVPAADPAPDLALSFEVVMAMICAARTEVELHAAAGNIGAMPQDEQQALNDKFDERLAEIRGLA